MAIIDTRIQILDFVLIMILASWIIVCAFITIKKLKEEKDEMKRQCEEDDVFDGMSTEYFSTLCFPFIDESVEDEFTLPDQEHVLIKFFTRGIALSFKSAKGNEIVSTRKTIETILAIWEPEGVGVTLDLISNTYQGVATHEGFAEKMKETLKNEYVIRVPTVFEKIAQIEETRQIA